MKNLITDIPGLLVGNAHDETVKTGVTAIICEAPCIASVQVLGGAPGTRETDLLEPHNTVETVDAIVLSGGSAFGLDACSGVQAHLHAAGRGFAVGPHRIPIVPGAILFDLINGGNKDWGNTPPYRALGLRAAELASRDFDIGSVGAGHGALIAGMKGGLGSASTMTASGHRVGALVAVNAIGSATMGDTGRFWAAPFEQGHEFGGLGWPNGQVDPGMPVKFRDAPANTNTTIAVVATDAKLTKAQAKRLAISAHDGFAKALWPSHTAFDGDIVFALATGHSSQPALDQFIDLCAAASSTMARAIARGVHAASTADNDLYPTWRAMFGQSDGTGKS